MKAFFTPGTVESETKNRSFEGWLLDTCCNGDYTEEERTQMLVRWVDTPGARFAILEKNICYLCMFVMGQSKQLAQIGLNCAL